MKDISRQGNAPSPQWYNEIWTLDIKDMSWVENAKKEVDFLIKTLGLSGNERILDLACGFGRHSIEFAKQGFQVVGVDITPDYIREACRLASLEKVRANFICADIRQVSFNDEFELVINMADGAIGYLENDIENEKIFDLAAAALVKGGIHCMNICNAEHAELYFPKRHWEIGEIECSLAEFHWDKEKRRMLYGGWQVKFGEIAQKPDSINFHSSIRLYSLPEIKKIYKQRGMRIIKSYSDFTEDAKVSPKEMQLLVVSKKV